MPDGIIPANDPGESGGVAHRSIGKADLRVEDLTMHYLTRQGEVQAVDGVSFDLPAGQSLGLVGESGCGKSSVAISLMKLLPDNARLIGGQVFLGDEDLLAADDNRVRRLRWDRIAMVFQAAMNALDPVYRVVDQIIEAIEAHRPGQPRQQSLDRVAELFRLVGLDPSVMDRFPHELSGGMRQRAVIAMALSCEPDVVIADEPTTALDVVVQDRILRELKDIQQQLGMSIIYITHDIGVVAEFADRLAVMYAGQLVELGDTADVFGSPIHPYTAALLSSFPSIKGEKRSLENLPGEPPNLVQPPTGCRFHPRCPRATDVCRWEDPPRTDVGDHWAACWHPLGLPDQAPVS